jgi:hypothetical protein
VCKLHERHAREGGPLEARIAIVRRVRELLRDPETLSPDDAAELARSVEDNFERFR